jgi:hypothetical protein
VIVRLHERFCCHPEHGDGSASVVILSVATDLLFVLD